MCVLLNIQVEEMVALIREFLVASQKPNNLDHPHSYEPDPAEE